MLLVHKLLNWRPDGYDRLYGKTWVLCMLGPSESIKDRPEVGPLIKFEQYRMHASDMGTSKSRYLDYSSGWTGPHSFSYGPEGECTI